MFEPGKQLTRIVRASTILLLLATGLCRISPTDPWLLPEEAVAQQTIRDTIPANVLSRVGAAVERYRTGRVVFVAVCWRPAYSLLGVFETAAAADAAAAEQESLGRTCATLPVQTELPDTTAPMSASLARVLGEAADGSRTGDTVFIVASRRFPHPILGVFTDREDALEAAADSLDYDVFPFLTPQDFDRPMVFFGCVHIQETSKWMCPDMPDPGLFFSQIDSISYTAYTQTQGARRMSFPGSDVDAIFFGFKALDKFMIPYYTDIYGIDFVKQMRDSLAAYAGTVRIPPDG